MPEWMLTREEVKAVLDSCDNPTLYESDIAIAKAQARKLVEHIKEIGWSQLSEDGCSTEWCLYKEDWEQLRKEVGL